MVATTSNAPATVQLHPAYEGSFDLSTSSNYNSNVFYKDDTQDPAERGRKRVVEVKYVSRGKAAGVVGWGSGEPVDGTVVVRTSNAENVLSL